MLHHAFLTGIAAPSLGSIFQAAAGRAWTRRASRYHSLGAASGGCERGEGVEESSKIVGPRPGLSSPETPPVLFEARGYFTPNPHKADAQLNEGPSQTETASPPTIKPHVRLLSNRLLSRLSALKTDTARKTAKRRAKSSQSSISYGPVFVCTDPISPNGLSDHDAELVDPGRAPTSDVPIYEDDEAYEYLDEYDEVQLPEVHYGPLVTLGPPTVRTPRSPHMLLQQLLFFLQMHTPPTLSRLIAYHDAYPSLRSTRSFNVLIATSLRLSSHKTVKQLFSRMRAEGPRPDLETRNLWVKWMVRSGRWEEAWERTMKEIRRTGEKMPLPIWLAFFGRHTARAYAMPKARLKNVRGQPVLITPQRPPRCWDAKTRFRVLLDYVPKLALTEEERREPPLRATTRIIYAQLRIGDVEAARANAETFFASLPKPMNGKQRRACLEVVHLHIAYGYPGNKRSYLRVLHGTLALLEKRPDLEPTPTTVFLVLRGLKKRRAAGRMAERVLETFEERWGSRVVGRRVRRRVASLAAKQGRWDLVKRMVEAEGRMAFRIWKWKAWREVLGGAEGSEGRQYRRLLRWESCRVWKKRGKEWKTWWMLERRIWRRLKKAVNRMEAN